MIKFRGYEILIGWLILDQRFRKDITEKVILKLKSKKGISFGRNILQVEGIAIAKTLQEGKNLAFPSIRTKSTLGKKESCV